MFSASSLIGILESVAAQQEGSRDFYDFIEFQYSSDKFKDCSKHELISLAYSFYTVHAGSKGFMKQLADHLVMKLDDKTTTFDLLRVL